jgi:hypothetical protein
MHHHFAGVSSAASDTFCQPRPDQNAVNALVWDGGSRQP